VAGGPAAGQPSTVDPSLQIDPVVSGLNQATTLDFLAPDDLLVVEFGARRVRRVLGGVLQPQPVLDVGAASGGTEAPLGIAINDESPPAVFLYLEDLFGTTGNRVVRYDWNPSLAALENPQTIFQIPPSGFANIHDAGVLMLGPPDDPANPPPVGDGQLLYVAIGDHEDTAGQLRNDPAGNPPDDWGVILRLLQDGSPAPGNPFTPYCSATTSQTCGDDTDCPGGETCRTEVAAYYAYGVRNAFGIEIDPGTGSLWDTENGPDEWDEVNRVEPGFNSGWLPLQGPGDPGSAGLFDMPGAGSTYSDPEFSWLIPSGPTGIAFPLHGALGAAYDDVLLFADFNPPAKIYALPLDAQREAADLSAFPDLQDLVADTTAELDQLLFASGFNGTIVDLEMGPDGALYVVSHFDGAIWRIHKTLADCADGVDHDGDGLVDHPDDPGCLSPTDLNEHEVDHRCDDGLDGDGDGGIDFPADPGCRDPAFPRENPACQDGIDNDSDGGIDFDGGLSILGPGHPDLSVPDSLCTFGWNGERKGCGLGFEVAFLVAGLRLARRRRTRHRAGAA
jgi:glucose/arabinose dehydrogenase